MILEVYFLNRTERLNLQDFLKDKGFKLVEKWNIDHVYVHNSVLEWNTNLYSTIRVLLM